MATGLLALLDDVAAIAKVAAASIDDVAAQTLKAGSKAAGIVIDDAAVTPRYVVGFTAERELSIIWRIAMGSVRNKLLFLLPAALALSAFAPWAITPILMLGGVYLCYEGAEKLLHMIRPHAEGHEAVSTAVDAKALEEEKIAGAIRTDIILSAEIMTISLATIEAPDIWTRAIVLAITGVAITAAVYGAVALIVKADDIGAAMARGRVGLLRAVGRGLVVGMPRFLALLSVIGTLAMLWVGGGLLIHGFAGFGFHGPEAVIEGVTHPIAEAVGSVSTRLSAVVGWLLTATASAIAGLIVGLLAMAALTLRPQRRATA